MNGKKFTKNDCNDALKNQYKDKIEEIKIGVSKYFILDDCYVEGSRYGYNAA